MAADRILEGLNEAQRRAAAEMEERVDTLVPYGYADVEIATFHAFGDRILREHALEIGLTPDFRVLNRAEQTIFLRDRLFELPLAHYRPLGDPTRHLQALITLISRCKDEDISPEEYQAHAGRLEREAAAAVDYEEARERAAQQRELAAMYAKYEELMTRDGCVDFGDQIVQVLRLFRRRPYVLGAYQRRFRYILVDEFQDTNHAQFELVKLLAARHSNVAVVGDEDQAIYRFRGAAISNILGFLDVYHDAAQIVLTENYRSTQEILDGAYRLIVHNNPDRLEVRNGINKRLTAVAGRGHPPVHWHYETGTQEADAVAETIRERIAAGTWKPDDVAILVRGNADADQFLRSLNVKSVPWTFSGNSGLYDRPEIRLLIAFLRALVHTDESVSLHYLASSDLYEVPIVDLTRCSTYADRRHVYLFDVFRKTETIPELRNEITEEGHAAIRHLVQDLERYMELGREVPTGDYHLQEERRLFYVGMTRARRELFLTNAGDYGGSRQRKTSLFVLEALDLPRDASRPFKIRPVEEIEHHAPPAEVDDPILQPLPPDAELNLSHKQIDDYQTCPLKYFNVHVRRIPIRRHHAVAYGAVMHKVVEYYLRRRVVGNYTPLDDLLAVYDRAWAGEDIIHDRPASHEPAEGFLTREHEEARRAAGREALRRFWNHEEAEGTKPSWVEKEFGFALGPNRVRGRYDRVDEDLLGAVIVDYKTTEINRQKDADRRVAESLQLKMYALAWQEMTGTLPQRLELRFIDSNVVGRHTPTAHDLEKAIAAVKTAGAGIRARRFDATPSWGACRSCAYNQICPFTATRD